MHNMQPQKFLLYNYIQIDPRLFENQLWANNDTPYTVYSVHITKDFAALSLKGILKFPGVIQILLMLE